MLLAGGNADLAEIAHGLDAGLGEVTRHGLVDARLLDLTEANLDGVVAVGGNGLDLRNDAGAGLNDRNGDDVIVLVKHLGHPDLAAEDGADHTRSLPSVVLGVSGAPCASSQRTTSYCALRG